jgi:hypothetical protein
LTILGCRLIKHVPAGLELLTGIRKRD